MYGRVRADTSKSAPCKLCGLYEPPVPEFVKGAADGVFSHGVNLGKAMSFIWEVAPSHLRTVHIQKTVLKLSGRSIVGTS